MIPTLLLGLLVFRVLSPSGLQVTAGLLLMIVPLPISWSWWTEMEQIAQRHEVAFSAGIVGAGAMVFPIVYRRSMISAALLIARGLL